MKKKSLNISKILFYIFTITLVISNLSLFSNNIIRLLVLYVLFAGFAIYYLFKSNFKIPVSFVILVFVALLIEFYLILVKDYSYSNDRVIFLIMDIGMLWIGYNARKENYYNNILKIYVLSCVFSSIFYLLKFDTSLTYGYGLKHCLAVNIIFAFFIVLIKKDLLGIKSKLLCCAVFLFTIINLNSRSGLIGLICCICYLVVTNYLIILKYIKKHIIPTLCGITLVVFFIQKIIGAIYVALRFDSLQSISLDRYSADRLPMIREGLLLFKDSKLFGIGNTSIIPQSFYVECFPIDVLVQLGFVGFILYFIFYLILFILLFKNKYHGSNLLLAKACFIASLIISLFSANAPMGPGTAFSFMWFLIGVALQNKQEGNYND